MNKNDLRTGYVVVTRNGEYWKVLLNVNIGSGKTDMLHNLQNGSRHDIDDYKENLIHNFYCGSMHPDMDIIKIYEPFVLPLTKKDFLEELNGTSTMQMFMGGRPKPKLLWKRKEDKCDCFVIKKRCKCCCKCRCCNE